MEKITKFPKEEKFHSTYHRWREVMDADLEPWFEASGVKEVSEGWKQKALEFVLSLEEKDRRPG